MKSKGVKLQPQKCELFTDRVKYLGRIVTSEGYYPDPNNGKIVKALSEQSPKTVGDLRHVLGLLGYYRPGTANRDADSLSTLGLNELMTSCTENIPASDISAIVSGVSVQSNSDETWFTWIAQVEAQLGNKSTENIFSLSEYVSGCRNSYRQQ